jgi:hypothetical protein
MRLPYLICCLLVGCAGVHVLMSGSQHARALNQCSAAPNLARLQPAVGQPHQQQRRGGQQRLGGLRAAGGAGSGGTRQVGWLGVCNCQQVAAFFESLPMA